MYALFELVCRRNLPREARTMPMYVYSVLWCPLVDQAIPSSRAGALAQQMSSTIAVCQGLFGNNGGDSICMESVGTRGICNPDEVLMS